MYDNNLFAHDKLELLAADAALGVAQPPADGDGLEVRLRHVQLRPEGLGQRPSVSRLGQTAADRSAIWVNQPPIG